MRDCIAIVRELNLAEVKLQFDVYHTAMTDPDVAMLVRDNIAYTACYQAADAPFRAQPGTGVLNFSNILNDIKAGGFDGYFCWNSRRGAMRGKRLNKPKILHTTSSPRRSLMRQASDSDTRS